MREALLCSEEEMTVLVVQAVNRDTAEQNDRGANQNVDGGAEFTRPVAAVELQEERRNEEEDRCFAKGPVCAAKES